MATLTWSSPGDLRCAVTPRSVLLWLLLALLLTGAASYMHGSRYGIVPAHGTLEAVPAHNAGTPLPVEPAAHPGVSTAGQPTGLSGRAAGFSVGPAMPVQECCVRTSAPRGEPAPLKTGVPEPPFLTHGMSAWDFTPAAVPPEPVLRALTVVQLCISRT